MAKFGYQREADKYYKKVDEDTKQALADSYLADVEIENLSRQNRHFFNRDRRKNQFAPMVLARVLNVDQYLGAEILRYIETGGR